MSFVTLKPYFQKVMKDTNAAFREWKDAFDIENIPAQVLDGSWHISFESANYVGTAHTCLGFRSPVKIEVIIAGNRKPHEAIDTAHKFADAIIREACKPTNRLNQAHIKNVLPESVNVRELSATNNNVVVLEIRFICENLIHF